jgi:hypothetical protein
MTTMASISDGTSNTFLAGETDFNQMTNKKNEL